MKLQHTLVRPLLFVCLSAVSVLLIAPSAMANEHEQQCFEDIQGKLPWNDDNNNLNWDPENIKQLCKGTTQPAEPRKCFSSIRSGHVNWGGGTDWEWKNIINLCSGTNNADKTAECFKNGISAKKDWRDAILLCQRSEANK
ncbi:MAG: hypothetical protein K9L60_08160 [Methylovulum sp.]|nr:hypothetical protein [Methylovulum sp.]MCF7999169.1 hypothetical protein [Methylovulum sp.]